MLKAEPSSASTAFIAVVSMSVSIAFLIGKTCCYIFTETMPFLTHLASSASNFLLVSSWEMLLCKTKVQLTYILSPCRYTEPCVGFIPSNSE